MIALQTEDLYGEEFEFAEDDNSQPDLLFSFNHQNPPQQSTDNNIFDSFSKFNPMKNPFDSSFKSENVTIPVPQLSSSSSSCLEKCGSCLVKFFCTKAVQNLSAVYAIFPKIE
jgi:hypothetical protein